MNDWKTTEKELPTINDAEIETMDTEFVPHNGLVSIVIGCSPFLIKEKDGKYWRSIGQQPLYWRYKNAN